MTTHNTHTTKLPLAATIAGKERWRRMYYELSFETIFFDIFTSYMTFSLDSPAGDYAVLFPEKDPSIYGAWRLHHQYNSNCGPLK